MTVPTVARVDVGSLALGRELGTGGQGKVTAVNQFLVNRQWSAVLKLYSPAAIVGLRPTVLEKLVSFPRQLGPEDSSWLHEHTAWPAVIVEDDDVVSGFLMRSVPAAYHFDFRTQTQGVRSRLADVAFLLNADEYLMSAGLAVSDQDRLTMLSALAGTLSRLHSLGVVIGDLSPKNLLFSPGASPGCFIIDCDTVRLHGETVLDQVDTPDWESPTGEPKATVATDAYKFGLLAIRLFARDQSTRDVSALAALSPELGRLAEDSLSDDPDQRPSPYSWLRVLGAARPVASPAPPPAPPIVIASLPSARPATVTVPADTMSSEEQVLPGGKPTRWRAQAILGAAAIVVVIAAVAGVALGLHKSPTAASTSDPPGGVPVQSGTTAPSSPAPAAGPTWATYQDPGEFSMMLPTGWSVSSQTTTEVEFSGQPQGFVVVVAWTTHPKPDALTDWQQQAASKSQADPTYHQISIQRVSYRGYNAADWDFINGHQGTLTRVVDRGFIVQPGQLAYAIELYGPSSEFAPVYAQMWNKLVTSFEPAS
jgi:hypothetical protein